MTDIFSATASTGRLAELDLEWVRSVDYLYDLQNGLGVDFGRTNGTPECLSISLDAKLKLLGLIGVAEESATEDNSRA